MASSFARSPAPCVDKATHHPLPPTATTCLFSAPPLPFLPDESNFGLETQFTSDVAEAAALDELQVYMGQLNGQYNPFQLHENTHEACTFLPTQYADADIQGPGSISAQDTISPYLLSNLGGANYREHVHPDSYTTSAEAIDLSPAVPDGSPAFLHNLTCSLMHEAGSPKAIEMSPTSLTIPEVDFAPYQEQNFFIDSLGLGGNYPLGFSPVLTDSLDLQQIDHETVNHCLRVPQQLYPPLEDNTAYNFGTDINSTDLSGALEDDHSLPVLDTRVAVVSELFDDDGCGFENRSRPEHAHKALRTTSKCKSGQRDTSKDQLLLECKLQGMSYKKIKELCHFEEAESTLRGRYRALTKPREARLRKPEWGQREIRLLFEGVSHVARSNHISHPMMGDLDTVALNQFVNKVPWKQVAEYMENQGAYRYGNWTVKKKYMEVLKQRTASRTTKV